MSVRSRWARKRPFFGVLSVLAVSWFVGTTSSTASVAGSSVAGSGSSAGEWPTFRFSDAHTGFNPYEHVLTRATASGLVRDWQRIVSFYGVASSPSIAGQSVFVANSAFSVSSGAPRWSFPPVDSTLSSPAVAAGIVYVGATDGYLYARSQRTGQLIWRRLLPIPPSSSPVVSGGLVYIGDYNRMFAFDAATGRTRWTHTVGSLGDADVSSSPAVVGHLVYVGVDVCCIGKVDAFDAATGSLAWSASVPNPNFSSPSVSNGVVYIGAYPSPHTAAVYALNAATGTRLWRRVTGGPCPYSSPAVADNSVYIGCEDGKLHALNAATGATRWSFATDGVPDSSPAVAGGVVYIGTNAGYLYALDTRTGHALWQTRLPAALTSPAVAGGRLYIGAANGSLYAFHLSP